MRQDEDWSQSQDNPLKNIPLGRWRLSIGGDTRQRFEWFSNEGTFGTGSDGFYLQRYMLHADLRLSNRVRIFGQLRSGLGHGRIGGARPVDRDDIDVHQAWVEMGLLEGLSLRAGRQEVNLGSSRLIAIREGPNVRLSFDGARLTWRHAGWRTDILALRPSQTNRGAFDNSPDFRQSLWGVYSTWTKRRLDVYYLGLDRKRRRFDDGFGREERHSFGARWWRPAGKGLDYDVEALWQTGRFAGGDINAWTTGTSTGYTWEKARFQPRVSLKADIASGDGNPGDRKLGTFNALYPKGNYFSQADLLGPYNLMDVHPSLELKLPFELLATVDADFFWRHSTRDGIYDVPGFLIVSGRGSRARNVGRAIKGSLEWQANKQLSFEAEYQYFWAGRFLREVGRPQPVEFFAIWATYRF